MLSRIRDGVRSTISLARDRSFREGWIVRIKMYDCTYYLSSLIVYLHAKSLPKEHIAL